MSRRASGREARVFLRKARQYLDSATDDLDSKRYTPAVSDAVIRGINAADAICIAGTGSYNASNQNEADSSRHVHARAWLDAAPG